MLGGAGLVSYWFPATGIRVPLLILTSYHRLQMLTAKAKSETNAKSALVRALKCHLLLVVKDLVHREAAPLVTTRAGTFVIEPA